MTRKLFPLLSILAALLLTSVPACAGSVTITIPRPPAEVAAPTAAPNYGLLMNVEPLSTDKLEDGSIRMTYSSVTDADHLAFGSILADLGFEVLYRHDTALELQTTVQNGDMVFTFSYIRQDNLLSVVYPAGLPYEQPVADDPFSAGYIRVHPGDTLNAIGDRGCIYQLIFSEPDLAAAASILNADAQYAIRFDIDVWQTSSFHLNDSFSPQIHFVTEDNHYVSSEHVSGYIDTEHGGSNDIFYGKNKYGVYANRFLVYPFQMYYNCYTAFPGCHYADARIIAVTFTLPGHELPFVLYLRGGN